MARGSRSSEDSLGHIVVCGGSPAVWQDMTAAEWTNRLTEVAGGAAGAGVSWVTLIPHHRDSAGDISVGVLSVLDTVDGVREFAEDPCRRVWSGTKGVSVVVDVSADGHERFARTVERLRCAGADVTEEELSRAVLAPAVGEPDLALIIGPPDVVPSSLVWELAYSELVFLDIRWQDLAATHVEMAIDDFSRRHRRFGGLDS